MQSKIIEIKPTANLIWESYQDTDQYNDPIFSPGVSIPVRQLKSITGNRDSDETTKTGFNQVYICWERNVKARDLVDGHTVVESRDILDVFGNYVYTKLYLEVKV